MGAENSNTQIKENLVRVAESYNNLSSVYRDKDDLDHANDYYKQTLLGIFVNGHRKFNWNIWKRTMLTSYVLFTTWIICVVRKMIYNMQVIFVNEHRKFNYNV